MEGRDIGIGKSRRYFDEYASSGTVMQNHLIQILALIAMGPPRAMDADASGTRKWLSCVARGR